VNQNVRKNPGRGGRGAQPSRLALFRCVPYTNEMVERSSRLASSSCLVFLPRLSSCCCLVFSRDHHFVVVVNVDDDDGAVVSDAVLISDLVFIGWYLVFWAVSLCILPFCALVILFVFL
jgi:hypothetical protein